MANYHAGDYPQCTCNRVWGAIIPAPPCPMHDAVICTFVAPSHNDLLGRIEALEARLADRLDDPPSDYKVGGTD